MTNTSGLEPERIDAIRTMLAETVAGVPVRRPARRRVVVAVSFATALALILTGVGIGTNGFSFTGTGVGGSGTGSVPLAAKPTDTSTTDPSPSSSVPPGDILPAAPVSPTPIVNPADPTTWKIDYGTLGPITLRASAESKLLAAGFSDYTTEGCATVYRWSSSDSPNASKPGYKMEVTLNTAGVAVASDVYEDGGTDAASYPGSPTTVAGIGLGASLNTIKATYPGLKTYGQATAGGVYYVGPVAGYYLIFETDVGRDGVDFVNSISASTEAPGAQLC